MVSSDGELRWLSARWLGAMLDARAMGHITSPLAHPDEKGGKTTTACWFLSLHKYAYCYGACRWAGDGKNQSYFTVVWELLVCTLITIFYPLVKWPSASKMLPILARWWCSWPWLPFLVLTNFREQCNVFHCLLSSAQTKNHLSLR